MGVLHSYIDSCLNLSTTGTCLQRPLSTVPKVAVWRGSEAIVFKHCRTAKDIQVLDGCEIPPMRTEFLELVGEGAFGKVHKATLKDGMAYFEDEREWPSRPRKQKIIAVKELFGEFKFENSDFSLLVAM